MTRLYVVKVLKSHIQFQTKTLQPAKCIDKGGNVAWKMSSVKYAPSTDRRSGNQRMIIKVRHTNNYMFACVKGAQSDFMEEFIARNNNGVLNQKFNFGNQNLGPCQPS